jgi:hypothetical protein
LENTNINRNQASGANTAGAIGDTVIAVLDKLAGKQSDLKLSFEDLTFDTGFLKARVNGAVVLDVVMAKEAKP